MTRGGRAAPRTTFRSAWCERAPTSTSFSTSTCARSGPTLGLACSRLGRLGGGSEAFCAREDSLFWKYVEATLLLTPFHMRTGLLYVRHSILFCTTASYCALAASPVISRTNQRASARCVQSSVESARMRSGKRVGLWVRQAARGHCRRTKNGLGGPLWPHEHLARLYARGCLRGL